jgi:ribosomal protein S7
MVWQNSKLKSNTKMWIISLLRILQRNGKALKTRSIILKILLKIINNRLNVNNFFSKITEHLYLPIYFRKKVISGRKILLPVPLHNDKTTVFCVRLILSSIKVSNECLSDRIFNEMFDVYKNIGVTIKKRIKLCKDIKDNMPNLRFLR